MQQDQQPVKTGMIKVIGPFKFSTEDLLGKGSFGHVYKCVNTETQVEFAIKVIPRLKINKIEDLHKEVNIMKKLTGPNIVRLFKVVASANNIYQVMDLCDSDLYKIKKQRKKFPEEETIKIMTDLLKGFLELIENGIIHRDVKPANILMSKGVYKLADFGLSRIVDDLTNQKFATIVGTPLYMSPQLLVNEKYTTKSDIWSFGFIFYELLYGRTPWTGNSGENLIQNIREKQLIFDDRIPVSDLTKNVIERCLAKEEENRISWLELFQHPIFVNSFVKIQNLELRCSQLEKFIATSLRLQIASQNISIDELIARNNIKDKLSPIELELIFKKIDNNISKIEIQLIFNNIKKSDNQHIMIEDFQDWLDKFSIQFSNYKKYKEYQCLHDLKAIIKKHNQTLQMYFEKFNKKKDGQLIYQEFQLLILKLNENQSEQQIFEAFNFIEQNDKGYLTIDEFQNALDNLKN